MDESHRPVKLRKVVLGFPCNSNQTEFKFDLSLNYKMANIIQTYSDQKPTLVVGVGRRLNNMFSVFLFLIFMSFNRVVKVLNLLFCSFALQGKEPSSQLQFWPRMLVLSWAQSTSKGVFLCISLHACCYAGAWSSQAFIVVSFPWRPESIFHAICLGWWNMRAL